MNEIINTLTYKDVFLAFSYLVNLVALLVRDILWLRSILMGAQLIMLVYAVMKPNQIMIFSNGIFFSINTYQVIRLLLERRPIQLPEELHQGFISAKSETKASACRLNVCPWNSPLGVQVTDEDKESARRSTTSARSNLTTLGGTASNSESCFILSSLT